MNTFSSKIRDLFNYINNKMNQKKNSDLHVVQL